MTRAWIYDVRMAQFVLKVEKLSHIMGPRASQDLRSPSPIMAPGLINYCTSMALVVRISTKCPQQPRSQGLFPILSAGREKTLALAGHVPTKIFIKH